MRHPLCRLRRLPPLLREGDAPDGRGNPGHGCLGMACYAASGLLAILALPVLRSTLEH